jgi:hypothetical protein
MNTLTQNRIKPASQVRLTFDQFCVTTSNTTGDWIRKLSKRTGCNEAGIFRTAITLLADAIDPDNKKSIRDTQITRGAFEEIRFLTSVRRIACKSIRSIFAPDLQPSEKAAVFQESASATEAPTNPAAKMIEDFTTVKPNGEYELSKD